MLSPWVRPAVTMGSEMDCLFEVFINEALA
jgi:hypothetical protein